MVVSGVMYKTVQIDTEWLDVVIIIIATVISLQDNMLCV